MKKICIIILVSMISTGVSAQIAIAPKLGVNFTKINYGEDLDDRFDNLDEPFHVGLQGGVGADFGVSDNFSIYAELLFTQKGSKYEGEGQFSDPLIGTINVRQEVDVTTNYLELPLLARITFGDLTQFYFNIGPTAGYWLGGTVESEFIANGETQSVETDIEFKDRTEITDDDNPFILANEDVNRLDLGAAIGAGVLFGQTGKFNLDFRYSIGLSSIYEENDDPDNSWKNNVLSVSIGYFFGMDGGLGYE